MVEKEGVSKCIVSLANYEGGLTGHSATNSVEITNSGDDLRTEYAFVASDSAITCAAASGNLLVIGGYDEVVRIFDLETKRSAGELAGVHQGSLTSLAISRDSQFVFSGAEDGQIVIWRLADKGEPLHRLQVKNINKVVSLSMHSSGRMMLALYQNGMLRLWNLLDARCLFKRKVGLSREQDSEGSDDGEKKAKGGEDGDESSSEEEEGFNIQNLYQKPEQVAWEPSQGNLYVVLFTRLMEIYSVTKEDGDEPLHSVTFDTQQTSFGFISPTSLVVADDKGRLTLFENI